MYASTILLQLILRSSDEKKKKKKSQGPLSLSVFYKRGKRGKSAQEYLKWQPGKVHNPYITSEIRLLLFRFKLCRILR